MTETKRLSTPNNPAEAADVGATSQPNTPLGELLSTSPATAVRCAKCDKDVAPTTPNHCPICGGWVIDNEGAVTLGLRSKKLAKVVDAYRVDLIAQLIEERGGRDALSVVERIAIENYALNCAQAKTIEARLDQDGLFTQTGRRRNAFDMLKGISETIDRLRAELPPVVARPSQDASISAMPTSALHLALDLLKRHETLSDRELGQLDVLHAAMDGRVSLPPDPEVAPNFPAYPDTPRAAIVEPGATSPPVSESTPAQPAPEPATCKYCDKSPSACVALREERPDVFYALHPIEAQKREDERLDAEFRSYFRMGAK